MSTATIEAGTKPPKVIEAPFTVIIDTREQAPYSFEGMWDGPAHGPKSKLIRVPTIRGALGNGDYSIQGMEARIGLERKSKADLYASISQRRENFVERLERMARTLDFGAVVVEAEWAELLSDPPPHTQFAPKALSRTIQAWIIRYPVRWIMAPGRRAAEQFTFRLLQRYWLDQKERPRERFDPGIEGGGGESGEALSDPAAEEGGES